MIDPDTYQLILDFRNACTTLAEKAAELYKDSSNSGFDIEEIGMYFNEVKEAVAKVQELYDVLADLAEEP